MSSHDVEVEFNEGDSILESCVHAGLPLNHSCDGNGTCGTCRVIIEVGLENLNPRNEIELEMAMDRGFAPNERLACQSLACSGLQIQIPD